MRKERASGSYRLSAYFLGKTISEVPMLMVLPIIFGCIVYWITGLRPEASKYAEFIVI